MGQTNSLPSSLATSANQLWEQHQGSLVQMQEAAHHELLNGLHQIESMGHSAKHQIRKYSNINQLNQISSSLWTQVVKTPPPHQQNEKVEEDGAQQPSTPPNNIEDLKLSNTNSNSWGDQKIAVATGDHVDHQHPKVQSTAMAASAIPTVPIQTLFQPLNHQPRWVHNMYKAHTSQIRQNAVMDSPTTPKGSARIPQQPKMSSSDSATILSEDEKKKKKSEKRKRTEEKALEKIKLQKEIQEEIETQMEEIEMMEEEMMAGDEDIDEETLLQATMGIPADALGLTTEVIAEDDDDVSYYGSDDKMDIAGEVFDLPGDDVKNVDGEALLDDDYDKWLKEQQMQEWSIIYSKKPELIIDKDEYDKILLNLLMSYQEFKQSINDLDELKKLRNENIRDSDDIDNSEQRRAIKRKPKKIRKFFTELFENLKGDVRIDDVKFDYPQFKKYVKIVSNNEMELIHGGDHSKLIKHLKSLWKTLAQQMKEVEKETTEIKEEKELAPMAADDGNAEEGKK